MSRKRPRNKPRIIYVCPKCRGAGTLRDKTKKELVIHDCPMCGGEGVPRRRGGKSA